MLGKATAEKAKGPLRLHPTNPRYFTDGSGRVVYLTGSHTWGNLQEYSPTTPPMVFDYAGYLDFLQKHHHNFMRMWCWESPCAEGSANPIENHYSQPLPYQRTGPGAANDGDLKFDVTKFNQAYFDRLRSRVIAARDCGIYVSVMLFQGWSVWNYLPNRRTFVYHPFHKDNNINGINGDANGNGEGEEVHSLSIPAITRLQEAYVWKVVDAVNDLDNVLFEISNESRDPATSTAWQYHIINYLKNYEAGKPKQHPVGMTANGGDNTQLFGGPADWISPRAQSVGLLKRKTDPLVLDPPAADGKKVVLFDTDHLGAENFADDATFSRRWVWRSFTRGYNPILMELHQTSPMADARPGLVAARRAMGHTLVYAQKMDLVAMTPQDRLASTGYCLANVGQEYLVYSTEGASFTVDLSGVSGTFSVERFNPRTGVATNAGTITGGASRTFTLPDAEDWVIYLRHERP